MNDLRGVSTIHSSCRAAQAPRRPALLSQHQVARLLGLLPSQVRILCRVGLLIPARGSSSAAPRFAYHHLESRLRQPCWCNSVRETLALVGGLTA